MDVSFLRSPDAALTCDYCNYPRRGLPTDALCPECGNSPPERAVGLAGSVKYTRKQQVQFRLVCIGLIILMVASFYAVRVSIIMDGEALSAINVPSPKVSGVVLIQREIGGRPGEWGVLGWTCCIWSMIGVWMITARRAMHREPNLLASSRQIARWSTLILTGGLAGYLLSDLNDYIPLTGRYTDGLLLMALLSVEIPVNFLLYRYLGNLAMQVRQPRLSKWLFNLAWLGALARCIHIASLVPGDQVWQTAESWRMVIGVTESMIAIPIGVVSWGAVLILTGMLLKIGFTNLGRRAVLLSRDRTGVLERLFSSLGKHRYRLMLSSGLTGWILLTITIHSENLLARTMGHDSIANSPALSIAGPKISAMIQWYSQQYERGPEVSGWLLTEMLIMMLLTTAIPGQIGREARLRFTLRWVAIIVISVTTQVLSYIPFGRQHPGYSSIFVTFAVDAYLTATMYVYLSLVAKRIGVVEISRWLIRFSILLPLLIILPRYFMFTRATNDNPGTGVSLLAAIISSANLVVFLLVVQTLLRFVFAILEPIWNSRKHLSVTRSIA